MPQPESSEAAAAVKAGENNDQEHPATQEPDLPPPTALSLPGGRDRAVVTGLEPEVAGGRYPAKRAQGQTVEVTAGVIVDGHEKLAVELCWQHERQRKDRTAWMPLDVYDGGGHNDEYVASFTAEKLGTYEFGVRAWIDRWATWQDQFRRRVEGGVPEAELRSERPEGAALLRHAAEAAEEQGKKRDPRRLRACAEALTGGDDEAAFQAGIAELCRDYLRPDRKGGRTPGGRPGRVTESERREVFVDPPVAGFGAWYEVFPRSTAGKGSDGTPQHATLDDAAGRLERIAEMGFDVVYLPPVHPIGETNRKGKDNAPTAGEGDPGSPWAIGGTDENGEPGGHKAVHPALGGDDAFDRFVREAEKQDLTVALDMAFQTSPDHPYIEEHPDWYYRRPDGSIRYAENPPKTYEDVHPLKFEGDEASDLWNELKSVFEHWIDRGVTTFRVDNPHTKPFAFWEWCLAELRDDCPELVVLSEAFTRPKIMHYLAQIGFNNSYTYFAWRNSKQELTEYARECFQTNLAEYVRPNFWPNTPDILTDELAEHGRPAHVARFVLAATLSPTYGVYGPPFEHVFNEQHPDREEYARNEKYEVRAWDWHDEDSLQPLFKNVNHIRRENEALQHLRGLRFHETHDDHLIAYTRQARDDEHEIGNLMLVVVNLDYEHAHAGGVELPLAELGLPTGAPFAAHDLLTEERYQWQGAWNYIRLDPTESPVHVFRLETE
ncbi:MAG: alpha-1,4-glucan--maltose-1-phosphate maltosyltransferase [Bacteroidetes bacterium QS_7_67_15]|nr:MAG: alpha-1,4-glucan--maltose-1-phosphate maltosyltransferase [Bacteroidetes bacterium QS_7_67_15]